MPPFEVSQQDIEAFRRDSAVLIRGLFAGHIEPIRAGMAEPWPSAEGMTVHEWPMQPGE